MEVRIAVPIYIKCCQKDFLAPGVSSFAFSFFFFLLQNGRIFSSSVYLLWPESRFHILKQQSWSRKCRRFGSLPPLKLKILFLLSALKEILWTLKNKAHNLPHSNFSQHCKMLHLLLFVSPHSKRPGNAPSVSVAAAYWAMQGKKKRRRGEREQ